MTAASIARALGGIGGSGWCRCRCPVHNSAGLTLALADGPYGLAVRCFAGCRRDDIFAELRRMGLLDDDGASRAAPDPEELARRREAEAASRNRRIAGALDIWAETGPAAGRLVETYLWSRLCCMPPPAAIRLHPSLWHRESGQRRPAMVALVEHVDFGRVGVHATYLAVDGTCKATVEPVRKSFGPVMGAAVRLAPIRADGRLVIAEGIETTLSVMMSTGLPGWAALSANGIARLILPPEARKVIIAADHDRNGTGQQAGASAARRFRQEGRRVKVCMPPMPGDWNDCLLGRIPAAGGRRHATR
jgi:hypothetical protein